MRFVILAGMAVIVSVSCTQKLPSIYSIKAIGLGKENLRFKSIYFLNSDTGFIAGSSDVIRKVSDGSSFASIERNAVLYRSVDGGRSWKPFEFGEGTITKVSCEDKQLIAIKVSNIDYHSDVFVSGDFGETWHPTSTFPNVVSDYSVIDNRVFLIAKDSSGAFQYYEKKSMGEEWHKVLLPVPIFDYATERRFMLYLSSDSSRNHKKDVLIKYTFANNKIERFSLPPLFDCEFIKNDNGTIRCCGKERGSTTIYSFDGEGTFKKEFSYGEKDRLFPVGFFSSSKELFVVVGKKNTADVSYKILVQEHGDADNPQISVIDFEDDKYIDPFWSHSVRTGVKAWFYSGAGTLQILE